MVQNRIEDDDDDDDDEIVVAPLVRRSACEWLCVVLSLQDTEQRARVLFEILCVFV